ncbi:hypothetical protein ACFQZ2_00560 [Streptomonospora algeriensis]|uniref:Uncharacterized protein n=1 Tax=Streptomonospora algeriensis TaxID=995084 RepID=A0ABW3BA32_9ACTN
MKPSKAELDALVEEAVVDAYGEDEQSTALHAAIEDDLAVPFHTTVLGVEVTVAKIGLLPGSGIVAIRTRGKHRQANRDPAGAGRLQSSCLASRSGALMSPVWGVPSASP